MSLVSQEVAKLGPAGQELNAIGAAIAPLARPLIAGIAKSGMADIIAKHVPDAEKPLVDNILADFLRFLGLE